MAAQIGRLLDCLFLFLLKRRVPGLSLGDGAWIDRRARRAIVVGVPARVVRFRPGYAPVLP